MQEFSLDRGTWLNPPPHCGLDGSEFVVDASEHSDFWRITSYDFVHDSGHALLNDFVQDSSLEVSWLLDYDQQFDQAGLFVYSDEANWIKAGIEFCDGAPQLGAVVTRDFSDWSVAPVSGWQGREVHLRISRAGDALTIRARMDEDWKLVRLCPIDPDREWKAGLFCASPSRGGLTVRFTRIAEGPADRALH